MTDESVRMSAVVRESRTCPSARPPFRGRTADTDTTADNMSRRRVIHHAMWCDRLADPPTFEVEPSTTRPDKAWRRCTRCGALALMDTDPDRSTPEPPTRSASGSWCAGTKADGASLREFHQGSANDLVAANAAKPSPYDYVSKNEMHGNAAGIAAITDGVSDEQFEEALTEAKSEGNLSRANVVRKLKGEPHRSSRSSPGRHDAAP